VLADRERSQSFYSETGRNASGLVAELLGLGADVPKTRQRCLCNRMMNDRKIFHDSEYFPGFIHDKSFSIGDIQGSR
jgi:hypothetical protein